MDSSAKNPDAVLEWAHEPLPSVQALLQSSPVEDLISSSARPTADLTKDGANPNTFGSVPVVGVIGEMQSGTQSPRSKANALSYPLSLDSAPTHYPGARATPRTPTMHSRTPKPLTPRPVSGDPIAPGAQRSPERPLNVTDALSYLDAVKMQFQDQPDVYNHFLDIMKDFKSQLIDTPGVIERVSILFHENPYLIQGFNTFLPFGYRIEVSTDPHDPNMITVTTPMGTTTQSTNAFSTIPRPPAHIPGLSAPNALHQLPFSGPPPHLLHSLGGGPMSRSHTPHGYHHLSQPQPSFDSAYVTGFQSHTQTAAAASFLGNLRNPEEQGQFNHAIQYLNRIKARYPDDSNRYKQFLEILQTFQKEQRYLQDSQVHVQVQMLFRDAPDLISEFKDFLPELTGAVAAQGGVVILPQPSESSPSPWAGDMSTSAPVEKTSKKAVPPLKRKKRLEKDTTPVPLPKPAPSRAKKPKHHHKPDPGSPSFSPYVGPSSPQPIHPHSHVHTGMQPPQQPLPQHANGMQLGHSSSLSAAQSMATSAERLLFFDRAKKSLENRDTYEEFLKLLALFSKDIINIKTLVERTRAFLGDGDLISEFKELLGWDDAQDSIENGPPGSVRTGPPEALSALPADDGQGPSYRRLPDSEIKLACSGRDELCRSVLNDAWVSHPTWASEEAGFVAHKKNSFEEALHKSEEERHEYHVHIEALTRTIAILEPLNARIDEMTNDERTLFKLKPDLGGSGKSIYHRIIKKVYGREAGLEIIQALQDCPSVAIPVVLARLKQKDEEWRRAQREWSRTWREVDAKNFYKSLDHQGISFKANDKKNITAKHFLADIESLKADQENARKNDGTPTFSRGSVGYQLEYSFNDTSVLHDCLKMVYSFLDHSQSQYSSHERRSVEKFLRSFIPLLCMYPTAEFNAACGPLNGLHEEDMNVDSDGYLDSPRGGRRSASAAQTTGMAANDLRRKLLKTAQEKYPGRELRTSGSTVVSRAASPIAGGHSPTLSNEVPSALPNGGPEDIWIKEAASTTPTGDMPRHADKERRPFFANITFYTLLRLLQLLYYRLLMCKDIGSSLSANRHSSLLSNPVAVELGLDDANGPSAVLAQAMDVLSDRHPREDANVVYMYLLDACEKVFDNELDQATFEEHMRWFFGNKAYHVFTLDKLITALVKQVQTILADNKCQELWSLLQHAQGMDTITNQDIIRYRREAERHLGTDDHLYKIEWLRSSKKIRIQLIGSKDPSVDGGETSVSRWREYVDTFVMDQPTEWIPEEPAEKHGPVYLRRFVTDELPEVVVVDNTKIRISLGTYKLFYESGSEWSMFRKRTKEEEETLRDRAHLRQEERNRSCWTEYK